MTIILAAASASALSVTGAVAAPPTAQKSSPARADWTKVVVDTGTGWRMGSAKAPTRLVEYGSFNCGHCAAFAKGAMPSIRKLVAAGKLSYEFRPKQIFPHDPSATLLAHCVGKTGVFAFTDDYMDAAPAVLAKLRAAYKADPAVIDKAGEAGKATMSRTMARLGAMVPIAQRHGVNAARADQCLGDPKLMARVQANEDAALAAGVKSTPTFFVNGKEATMADLERLGIPVPH